VHMFVFYYGIMADITPPVGLATFAAAAISGEDPIKTGIQGVKYAMRTAVLPFMFVFNPLLLLIDVEGWFELVLVVGGATLASLTFAAATMRWMRVKCSWVEVVLLLVVTFALFRPGWFMDYVSPKYETRPASELLQVAAAMPDKGRLVVVIEGMTLEGDDLQKTVAVPLPALPEGSTAQGNAAGMQRLTAAGLTVMALGDQAQIASVRFGSQARRAGWEQGWNIIEIKVPNPSRPSEFWFYIPAFLILAFIWVAQGRRSRSQGTRSPVAA